MPKFWDENRPMMLFALKLADNPDAIFGPKVQAAGAAGQLSLQAESPIVQAEYFVGRPGAAGTGTRMQVADRKAVAAVRSATRQVVYVHAKGANGAWGPWDTTWSN
ncbi:hypothetical protein D3C86_2002430 [compost metagenome]